MSFYTCHFYKNLLHLLDFALGQGRAYKDVPEESEGPQFFLVQFEVANAVESFACSLGGILTSLLSDRICLYRIRLYSVKEGIGNDLYSLGKVERWKLVTGGDGDHLRTHRYLVISQPIRFPSKNDRDRPFSGLLDCLG